MSQRYASRRKVLAFLACVLLFILLLYETHEEETKHRSLTRDRLAVISLLTFAFPSYAIPLPALCLFLFSSVCVSSCSSLTTLSSSTSLLSSPSSFSARSPFPSFPSLSSSSSLSSPLFSSSSASFSSSLHSSISLPSSFPDNKLLEELTTAAGTPAASHASSFMVSTAAPPPVVLSNRATATTAAAATASQNSKPPTGESAATLYKRHELEAATPPSTGAAAETAPPRADARHSDVDISPFIGTRQHNILMASVEREGQRQRVAEGREFIYPVDSPLLQQQKQQSQSRALSPQQQALEALSVRAEAEAAEREEGERDTGLERVTTREEDKGEDEYRAGPEEKEEKGKERIAVRYRSFSNDVPEQPSALLTSFPLLSSSSSSSDLNSPFLPALSLQSAAAKGAALPSDEELPVSVALVTSRVSETEETVNEGKKSSDSKKYTNPSSISTSTKTGDERLHHRKIQGYGNSKNYQRSRKGSEGRHNRRSESPSSRHTLQRGIKSGNTNRGEQFIQFDDAGMHCSSVRESDSTGRHTQQVFRDDQKHSSNSSTSCTSHHCGNSEKRKVPSVEESRVNSEVAEEVGDDLKPEGCGKFCRNISKDNVWQRHRHGCGHGLHGKSVTHTDGSNIAKNEGKVAGAEKWSGIKESVNGDNESIRGERGGSNSSTGNESDEEGGDAKHGALWRSTKVSTMRGEHEHPEGRNRERNKRLGNKRNNNNEEKESHFSSSPSNKLATMRHSDSPDLRIETIKSSQPVTSRAPITRWNIVQQPLLVNSDDSRKDREESVTTEGEEEEAAKMGQGDAPVLDKEERTVSSERPPTPDTETTPLVKTSSVDNGVFNTTSAASSSSKPTITDIIASNSTRPVIAGAKSDAPADAGSVSARHVLPAVSSPSSSMSPSSDSLAPSSVHFPSSSAPSPSTPSSSGSSSVASSSPSFPSSTSTVRPSSSSSAPSSSVTSPSSPASASSRALPWRKSANREASNSPTSRKSTTEDSNKAIVVVESSSSSWIEEWRWLWLILMSFFLVVIAGIASGLTTGLMAFDELQLLVVLQTGIGSERQQYVYVRAAPP